MSRRPERAAAVTVPPAPRPKSASAGRPARIAVVLAAVAAAPFLQLATARFINFDDPNYVVENPWVRRGLTADGLRWSVTTTEMANWNPVTWWSHMLDVQLFGMWAGGHHLTSVALHALNTVLLFVALRALGVGERRSAVVALLFGVHPLHVESVAWIAERKDVLSTTFLFLTLWRYAAVARRPSVTRYAGVLAAFTVGTACKPMLVTLPFVLLLLDVWPLGRWSRGTAGGLVAEKLPLLAVSAVVSGVTLVAQRGAMATLETFSVPRRIANALLGYATYLRKMVWPTDLAVFYPHPASLSVLAVVAAAVLLAGISVAVFRWRERRYLVVGWLWFAGMLVPVSGLVQVGQQALADRFTYVPLVGVFLMVVCGAAELAERRRVPLRWRWAAVAVVALACVAAAWRQASYWSDSATLFTHAMQVVPDNYMAYVQVGAQYDTDGDAAEAARYYRAALAAKADYPEAHNNLGYVLARAGESDAAMAHYDAALAAAPLYADAHYNRGLLLQRSGRLDEAAAEYRTAVAIRPDYVEALSNLGAVLIARDDGPGARAALAEAVRLRPDHVAARINLGVARRAAGDVDGAIAEYRAALTIDPRSVDAHYDLGNALASRGEVAAAIAEYRTVLDLDPNHAGARNMLATAPKPVN